MSRFPRTSRPALVEQLAARDGWACVWCSCPLSYHGSEDDEQATLDHLVPRSSGGPNEAYNLALACVDCNGRRLTKGVGRFAQSCADRGLAVRAQVLLCRLNDLIAASHPSVARQARKELPALSRILARTQVS